MRGVSDLLADLVSIPSENPALEGASLSAGEGELGRYVEGYLRSAGIEVTTQEVAPGRHNVIGHVGRGALGKSGVVVLTAHMDTYPPSAGQVDPFCPRVDAGCMHGRGSADAKASLASMLFALTRAAASERRREAYVVGTVDEEVGLTGARRLASLGIPAHLAITGEPTQLVPIIAQKGVVRFTVRVTGAGTHAAYPRLRDNTVFAAGRILDAIARFNAASERDVVPLGLSPSTVQPTRITGEGDMNHAPVETTMAFDARFVPGSTAGDFLERLESFVQEHVGGGVTFTVGEPSFVSPPNVCPQGDPVVAELVDSVRHVLGDCNPAGFSYGSEAGVLAAFARASLVFGPGNPKYSHGPDERVELDELGRAAAIFERLLVH
jgi:acetylornithine deacetylase/succinyl-diaminopimelate desuccinylase-like protein